MIRIGPAMSVPRIKNNTVSISFRLFFAKYVNPATIGKKVNSKKKSYLSKGPNVASPIKNLDGSIFTTSGYIEFPEYTTTIQTPDTITMDGWKKCRHCTKTLGT